MDEQKLKEMLQNIDAPAPDENARKQALNLAMAAFDQKKHKPAQGFSMAGRLTDIINNVRRITMQKRYVSGLAGGVALCALVAVLGVPFFTQQMDGLRASENFVEMQPLQSVGRAQVQGTATHMIAAAPQEQKAERRKEQASSAMPRMVGQADMSVPDMSAEMQAEPLKAWRKDTGAQKAKMMDRVAPAPATMGMSAEMAIAPMPYPVEPSVDYIAPTYQEEGRDNFQKFEENSVKAVQAEPVSTFSIDVDTASYSFMRRDINRGILPPANAIRLEELINYFDYDYALPQNLDQPFAPSVAVYDSPWNAHRKIVHIGIKGYEVETKPKSNLVFLIDTSGSMNSPDKLPLLKSAFKLMLSGLNADDTVSIVTYAGSAGTALEPTKVADKEKIMAALDALGAGGSTAGAAGIAQAYALAEQNKIDEGNNRIILATDGDFNVGISNPDDLKNFVAAKRQSGVYLSVLGFGQGNYNDHIMQSLAQNGNGNAAYIDTLNEARKVLVDEAASTLLTIAKDVKIQVEFNPAKVAEYRLVGYETRHLNREDFNNDKVDAGEVGAGATVTAIYEITPVGAPKQIDDLRYGAKEVEKPAPVATEGAGDEYAFLKIRYKKPDSDTSTLITRPITDKDEVKFAEASDDIRFAAAVAGFGQLLKNSNFVNDLTLDQVIEIATGAKGKDEFGYRAEFINLVRLTKGLK